MWKKWHLQNLKQVKFLKEVLGKILVDTLLLAGVGIYTLSNVLFNTFQIFYPLLFPILYPIIYQILYLIAKIKKRLKNEWEIGF